MSEIMKVRHGRETQKTKSKKQRQKWKKEVTQAIGKGEGYMAWICCAFKVGFLEIICKASLIFKLDLQLVLSIVLKERELYESKHMLWWNVDV